MLYVALLRGINVGGRNLIKMSELKDCFEAGGFEDVTTYIQSGNVLFRAGGGAATLESRIEKILARTFDYDATVVVRSRAQMRSIVEEAPKGFGEEPQAYMSDVLFLKAPLTAASALEQVTTRQGVDAVHAGRGVLYFSRLASMRSKSGLGKVVSSSIYKSMTIRNWTTTTRLVELMNG